LKLIYGIIASQHQGKEDQVVKAILCLGEIGTFKDLSKVDKIMEVVRKLFQSQNDQIRNAAAICLGNLAIGNTNFFLQQVFDLIEGSPPQ